MFANTSVPVEFTKVSLRYAWSACSKEVNRVKSIVMELKHP